MAELVGLQATVTWSGAEIDESVLYGHVTTVTIGNELINVERLLDVSSRFVAGTEQGIVALDFTIDSTLSTAPPKATGTHATLTVNTSSADNKYTILAIVERVTYTAAHRDGIRQAVGYSFRVSLGPDDLPGTSAITVS